MTPASRLASNLSLASKRLAAFMRRPRHYMLFVVSFERVRRVALTVLFLGLLVALTPFASFATGTVTLAWDPSSGTDIVTNYNIYYGAASATYTDTVPAGTNTTVTVSNLVEGTTYYFAATAVDTAGLESDYSIEVSALIAAAQTNQPPTLDALADVTINENDSLQIINLSGISSGAANENQTLTVTTSSSNPGLVPTPAVSYTSPNTTGSITFTPVASAYGSATVTVTVNDGGASNNIISRTFAVTINQVNTPPTISSITNRIIAMDSATAPISFTIADAETPAANLTLSGSSDNPTLVQTTDIVFGGSNNDRTMTITPESGQTGVANITLTVSDGTATAQSVFQLSVRQRPAAPGTLHITSTEP